MWIPWENIEIRKICYNLDNIWLNENELSFGVIYFLKDRDFVDNFILNIPNLDEQKKFIINSSNYELGYKYNSKYVLFFRRTLPSDIVKPEEYWTNEYKVVKRWLKLEISWVYRIHSIILCDSLKNILSKWGKKEKIWGYSDWELYIDFPDYDQKNSLFLFKPFDEQLLLEDFRKSNNYISSEQLLVEISIYKNKSSELL